MHGQNHIRLVLWSIWPYSFGWRRCHRFWRP